MITGFVATIQTNNLQCIDQESQDIQKCNILHQLLSLPDNVADIPGDIRTALKQET
jgi:hypothetical protein